MLNLSAKNRDLLKSLFEKRIPQMTVLAYGSRVAGTGHEGSDLDLVVINPRAPEQFQTDLAQLRGDIQESNLPILVDLLDWARMPADFREQVKRQYVILWGVAPDFF